MVTFFPKKLHIFSVFFLFISFSLFMQTAAAVEEPPQIHFVVKQLKVVGDNPLSSSQTDAILSVFTGDHYGLEGLQAASDALEKAFVDNGFSFYRVTFVPQSLQEGIVTFSVSQFHVENVTVQGNEHFSDDNILSSVPMLVAGETPNTRELSRSLGIANALPSKKVTVKFAGSENEDAVNAVLDVIDQDPGFFFIGMNNTGTDETGKFRLTGGYQYSNLFDLDHSITLSYTTSPDHTKEVNQYGLSYSIPLYSLASTLDFLYSSSDVDSGVVSNQFAVSGKGRVFSVRYVQTFLQFETYKHELELGFSRKLFDNLISLAGTPLTGGGAGQVVSRPFLINYRGSVTGTKSNFDFSLGGSSNIEGGTNNTQADYSAARAGATVDWQAYTFGLGYSYYFPDQWHLRLQLSGQYSNDTLITGEQFGLGGQRSIRGLEERILLGDKGYQGNVEVWLPPLTDFQIYSLLFYDFGLIENNQAAFGELTKETPASVGFGLRWYWQDALSVVFDMGFITSDVSNINVDSERAHIDVFYRF